MMDGQSMMDCMGMMGDMGWVMMLFWALLIALAVWGLYRLFTTRGGGGAAAPPRETPMEALRRSYAEGKISTEEYEERKRTLENDAKGSAEAHP